MRPVDALFARYAESHRHPVNKAIHWVCVPLITWTVLALAWALSPAVAVGLALAACVFYAWLSRPLAVGMLAVLATLAYPLALIDRHLRAACAGGLHPGVDRPVRRPHHRRTQAIVPRRPQVPADRSRVAARRRLSARGHRVLTRRGPWVQASARWGQPRGSGFSLGAGLSAVGEASPRWVRPQPRGSGFTPVGQASAPWVRLQPDFLPVMTRGAWASRDIACPPCAA